MTRHTCLALTVMASMACAPSAHGETALERVLARIGDGPALLFLNIAENRDPVAVAGTSLVMDGSITLIVHSEASPADPIRGPSRMTTTSIGATNAAGLKIEARDPLPGLVSVNIAQNAATVLGGVAVVGPPGIAAPTTLRTMAIGSTNTGVIGITLIAPVPVPAAGIGP